MKKKYPVHRLADEHGTERDFALVPLEEVEQTPAQRNLIQRVWGMLRSSNEKDKETPLTTDSGISLFAGSTTALIALRYYDEMRVHQARLGMLEDYERMDSECVEVSTALDIVVGNVFLPMEGDQETHEIVSDDASVKDSLDELDDRIDGHEIYPEIFRGLLHYGDSFEEIVVDAHPRIARLKFLHPKFTVRNEDTFGRLKDDAYQLKDANSIVVATFAPWQVIHTRYRHQRGNLYGRSFYFNSRRPWRQLTMMEDGVCIRYLTRAGKRFAFYIPVPKNVQPEEKRRVVQEAIKKLKRRSVVDSDGKMDLRRNPVADDEDFYIPVEEGSEGRARVDMLDTGGMNDNLAPVNYFRDKVVLPTRVPKAYMGMEQDTRGRAMLGWQDIEFGRMVRSGQKIMANFQRKLYDTELRLRGVEPEEDLYAVKYPPISFVDEQMKMAVEEARWRVAASANQSIGVPKQWLLTNILRLSEEDVENIMGNLEPAQPQGQPGQFGQQPGQFGQREMGAVKEAIFTNVRLQNELMDLKARLKAVLVEKLNQPMQITRTAGE